jgi:hypothetical protein
MIDQLKAWLGIDTRSGQVRLHQELAAIELTLALRNQQILTLYKEMDQLRDQRDELKLKLDQFELARAKSFRLATTAK